jgi:Tfp pilus assembly protein PilF
MEQKMNKTPREVSALLAVAALSLAASGACLAGPSNLWSDNHAHTSVAVPLDTPSQGIARARQLMHDQQHLRAARALHKVVTRWPNASQAHELMAEALTKLGETDLAEKHSRLARSTAAGAEPISTLN